MFTSHYIALGVTVLILISLIAGICYTVLTRRDDIRQALDGE